MIPPGDIFKEAHRAGVSDLMIEKDYAVSWLLVAIAESYLRDCVAFKGGTALKKVYYPEYRFSEDLDFTLLVDLSSQDLQAAVEGLFPSLARRPKIECARLKPSEVRSESTTVWVNFVGPLGAALHRRVVKIDFTRPEPLLDELNELPLTAPYRDYPSHVHMPTYTLQEILAEKLCALIGRNEPRDLYDIYWLLESGDIDTTFLPDAFATKAEHKGRDPARLGQALTKKKARLEKEWESRLGQQVVDLPPYKQVYQGVRRHIRKLELD